jgi:predicted Fe-Mo cluster-binding NifX family protein
VKVAVITDDGQTISQHFGRARFFLVATLEEGKLLTTVLREKSGHHTFAQAEPPGQTHTGPHGFDPASQGRHAVMLAAIQDCQVVLAGGMGQGMYQNLQQVGIRPVMTEIRSIEDALQAFAEGRLPEHPERVH